MSDIFSEIKSVSTFEPFQAALLNYEQAICGELLIDDEEDTFDRIAADGRKSAARLDLIKAAEDYAAQCALMVDGRGTLFLPRTLHNRERFKAALEEFGDMTREYRLKEE